MITENRPRFFIPAPQPTDRIGHKAHLKVYLDADSGDELLWSGKAPLPTIGAEITVTLNGIGKATVKGYFTEWSGKAWYVGVMTKAHNPPKWLRDQQKKAAKDLSRPKWYRDGIGCEFGMEIQ